MREIHKSWSRLRTTLASFVLLLSCVCCARTTTNGNLAQADPVASSPNSSASPIIPINNQSSAPPDELVRQFYAWYLGELRAGKEPSNDEEKMKQYVTVQYFTEHRAHDLPADPILSLPDPASDWYNMKVKVGKPTYYHRKPYYDAYVKVTYTGYTYHQTSNRNRTHYVDFFDEWSIGLQRTAAGWRIASMGIWE